MSQPLVATAYFDSSALVKRYVTESGTGWIQAWCDDPAQTVAVAEIGLVEIAAALARKLRSGLITPQACQDARAELAIDARGEYVLVTITRSLIDAAINLTARHPLRGYDAIHLACALHLNQSLVAQQLVPLVFVSADDNLLAAAAAEGLLTDNPHNHP